MSGDRVIDRCSSCDPRREFLSHALGFVVAIALPIGGAVALASGSERRYAIPSVDGVTIDRASQVVLVRRQMHAYAFALACPHQNTALKWLPKDGRFQCPKHDSKYQPDGTFMSGHATRNMDRFAIRRDGDALVVDVARWFQSDRQAVEWAAARVDL